MVERAPPFYLKKELRDYGKTRAIFFFELLLYELQDCCLLWCCFYFVKTSV